MLLPLSPYGYGLPTILAHPERFPRNDVLPQRSSSPVSGRVSADCPRKVVLAQQVFSGLRIITDFAILIGSRRRNDNAKQGATMGRIRRHIEVGEFLVMWKSSDDREIADVSANLSGARIPHEVVPSAIGRGKNARFAQAVLVAKTHELEAREVLEECE